MLKKSVCSAAPNILQLLHKPQLFLSSRFFSVQHLSSEPLEKGLKELENTLKTIESVRIRDLPDLSLIDEIIEKYKQTTWGSGSLNELFQYQSAIRTSTELSVQKLHKAMNLDTFLRFLKFSNEYNISLAESTLGLIMNELVHIQASYSLETVAEVLYHLSQQKEYKEAKEHSAGIQKIYARANEDLASIKGSTLANMLTYAEMCSGKNGPVSIFISRARLLLLSRSNYYLFELFKQRILTKIQTDEQGRKLSMKEFFKKYLFSLVVEGSKNVPYPEIIHFSREDLTKLLELYGSRGDKELITVIIDLFSQIESQIVNKPEDVEGEKEEELREKSLYIRCLKSLSGSYVSESSGSAAFAEKVEAFRKFLLDSTLIKVHSLSLLQLSELSEVVLGYQRNEEELLRIQKLLRHRFNELLNQAEASISESISSNFNPDSTLIRLLDTAQNLDKMHNGNESQTKKVVSLFESKENEHELIGNLRNHIFEGSYSQLPISKKDSTQRLKLFYLLLTTGALRPEAEEQVIARIDIQGIKSLLRSYSSSGAIEEAYDATIRFIEDINPLKEAKFTITEEKQLNKGEHLLSNHVIDYVFYATLIHCMLIRSGSPDEFPPAIETLISFLFLHYKELEPKQFEELAMKLTEAGIWKRKVKNEIVMNESLYIETESHVQSEWSKYSSQFQYTYRKFIYRQ